ncbi:MAG: CPBP family glutamic-type intramembrane protease [bacterium JZ-2024 1]
MRDTGLPGAALAGWTGFTRIALPVSALYILVLAKLWIPAIGRNPVLTALWVAVSAGVLGVATRARIREGAPPLLLLREAGFRGDTFLPALRVLALPTLTALLMVVALARFAGPPIGCFRPFLRFVAYFFWAMLQQYLLQGFIGVRLLALTRSRVRVALICALLFASLHLPNPALTVATALGGFMLTFVFLTQPNLYAVSLAHALVAVSMECLLPASLLPNMYVGYFYLHPPRP